MTPMRLNPLKISTPSRARNEGNEHRSSSPASTRRRWYPSDCEEGMSVKKPLSILQDLILSRARTTIFVEMTAVEFNVLK